MAQKRPNFHLRLTYIYGSYVLEVCFKFTTTGKSNFDKRCSDAHFASFLFYYYCKFSIFFVETVFSDGGVPKEIQIILRLFLVHHILLQTKSVSSQPASNVGGLVIHWTGLTVHNDD